MSYNPCYNSPSPYIQYFQIGCPPGITTTTDYPPPCPPPCPPPPTPCPTGTGSTGPTGPTGIIGPTGPVSVGTNIVASYYNKDTFQIGNGVPTTFTYTDTIVETGGISLPLPSQI